MTHDELFRTVRFGAHKMPRPEFVDFDAIRKRNLDMLAVATKI